MTRTINEHGGVLLLLLLIEMLTSFMKVSSIVVEETNVKLKTYARPPPSAIENFTFSESERHKRVLPYFNFYIDPKPTENNRFVQTNDKDPTIHIFPKNEKNYYSPIDDPEKVFFLFAKQNIPTTTTPLKQETKIPPNFSDIYEKLSRIKLMQTGLSSENERSKPQIINGRGKGPPPQRTEPNNKTKKNAIVYLKQSSGNNIFFPSTENLEEDREQERYELQKENALIHNNKQYFYEHPVEFQSNFKNYAVDTHGLLDNKYQPTSEQYVNYFRPAYNPQKPLINENYGLRGTLPTYVESKNKPIEEPVKAYPIHEQNFKFLKLNSPKQTSHVKVTPIYLFEKQLQIEKNIFNPVPPQLVEIISHNTMKHYQNNPTLSYSVPNLTEDNAKKNHGIHFSKEQVAPLADNKQNEKDQENSIAIENSENSLDNLLKKLQEINTLPKTFTIDNVDNSIKTLVHILNSLKKHKNILSSSAAIENNPPCRHKEENEDEDYKSDNFPVDTPEGGTPGKAGIDYPALTTIPKTSFDCKMQRYKGFFADQETSCQVWHYCDLNGGQASFLCPNGTIFSQVALTCDWWFNVKCASTSQQYVLNERLYKYIIPLTPKFPEDYSGPLVDRYLALKFKEMEKKMEKQKKGKIQAKENNSDDKSEEYLEKSTEDKKDHDSTIVTTLSEVNE